MPGERHPRSVPGPRRRRARDESGAEKRRSRRTARGRATHDEGGLAETNAKSAAYLSVIPGLVPGTHLSVCAERGGSLGHGRRRFISALERAARWVPGTKPGMTAEFAARSGRCIKQRRSIADLISHRDHDLAEMTVGAHHRQRLGDLL